MFAYDFFWLDYLKTFLVKTIRFLTRFPLENCQYKHVFVTFCSVTKIGTEQLAENQMSSNDGEKGEKVE